MSRRNRDARSKVCSWPTEGQVTRDEIYTLIATGDIYVDLSSAILPEPAKVAVWLEKPLKPEVASGGGFGESRFERGTRLDWDGRHGRLSTRDCSAVVLRSADGEITEIPGDLYKDAVRQNRIRVIGEAARETRHSGSAWFQPAEADLEEATRRFQIVSRALRGETHDAVPPRTLRRWIAAYRTGERTAWQWLYRLVMPKPNHGNPTSKLSEKARSLMNEHIDKDYESLKQKTMYAAWAALKLDCERDQIPAPSLKTFAAAVHQRAGAEQTQKRQGSRAAYQVQPFFWELEQRTPRHGDRPFEIGHIDHTQADVWVVCSQTGRLLGRPWLSLLTDAYSRRILALHLTFDPPSYRSAMMIVRECVRRHGRLPQILVLDGGKEFDSIYFETLLARCEVMKKTRPPAKARFGSTCERLFGTANTQFFHNLAGNTQAARNNRQMTKSVDPRNHAAWTLTDLHRMLTEYAYEVYDRLDHPALGQSPRKAFESTPRRHWQSRASKHRLRPRLPDLHSTDDAQGYSEGRGGSRHEDQPYLLLVRALSQSGLDRPRKSRFVMTLRRRHGVCLRGSSVGRVPFGTLRQPARPLGTGGSSGERGVAQADDRITPAGSPSPRVPSPDFLKSVEQEEAILIQRLSDLEARSLQRQPELIEQGRSHRTRPRRSRSALLAPVELQASLRMGRCDDSRRHGTSTNRTVGSVSQLHHGSSATGSGTR